jgi:NhaP-type Na+/H+ or K+/H+ antiporter
MHMAKYLYDRAEYARPWKLVTLALGIAFLIAGALWSGLPDWDIPISLIMALPAYLTAPCTMRVLLERRWKQFPQALFWTWFTVDGTYTIYWSFVFPEALVLRPANAGVSLALYGLCGLVWYSKASLREIIRFVVKGAA